MPQVWSHGEIEGLRQSALHAADNGFTPQTLQPLYALNRRLLAILVDESRKTTDAAATSSLPCGVLAWRDEGTIERLAQIPLSLTDAGFQLDERWRAVASGHQKEPEQLCESVMPRARALELAPLTFGLAWATAQSNRQVAQIAFGMSHTVSEIVAGLTVDIVQWLGQARAHWLRPRWHDRTDVWLGLIAAAEQPESTRVPPVRIRAMNRLLADLERARAGVKESRRAQKRE